VNNTETAHRISCSITIIYSLFTIRSSLRRCQAPFLSVPNALDFRKTCVIRHKNPPTDESVGGLSARTPRLVEARGVEPLSESRSVRLSTRLVGLLNLPRDSPTDRIALWQLFESASGYRALTRGVGCCVTPGPKPQHSSAGRAALRQLMQVR